MEDLSDWIGRRREAVDTVTSAPVRGLAAALDHVPRDWTMGDSVPLLAHWLYFLDSDPQHELGEDGHPRRGGFLPPINLPRRMWAGGRVRFLVPLRVGDKARRTSTILDIQSKHGRSGELVFVTVQHEIERDDGTTLVQEEQDIVYRDAPSTSTPPAAAPKPDQAADTKSTGWQRQISPDSSLLFRYSALTFNSHRIHFDRDYAVGVEGYPGLVVHGPLQATLLLDLLVHEAVDANVASFSFRAREPLFDDAPFIVCGEPRRDDASIALTTRTLGGRLGMDAVAVLSTPGCRPEVELSAVASKS